QLPHLLLERLDPFRLRRGRPRAQPIVDIGLANPEPHRLDPVAELASDPLDRPMLRPQLGPQLADQPDRLGLLRIRIPTRGRLPWRLLTWHDSILVSKVRSLQVTQGGSELLRHPAARTPRRAPLGDPPATRARDLRLDRMLVQPAPATLLRRDAQPHRL